ncbi:MAG: hypothetical protein HY903_08925 [Deltaproteobacteria bacterium]|nr:hypothetical protein [Deltaproteobacteria bacterium]
MALCLAAPAQALDRGLERQAESQHGAWSPTHFPAMVTGTKLAAEEIFYDMGNQRFLSFGARRKGAALGVRLGRVDVPSGIEGIDAELFTARFMVFTRSVPDLRLSYSPKTTDMVVSISLTPGTFRGARAYTLTIEAKSTRGKTKGKLLYRASRIVEP